MSNSEPPSGDATSSTVAEATPSSAPSGSPTVDVPFTAQVVPPVLPPAGPPPGPYAGVAANSSDDQNLNLLSTFHYVAALLVGLMPCFSIFHLGFGVAILTGQFPDKNPPPPILGWVFVVVPLFLMVIGWSMAALMVTAGRRLRQRRSHTFCMVIAGISCMFFPWGTVLGVFTLIVLSKPSVRAKFGVGARS